MPPLDQIEMKKSKHVVVTMTSDILRDLPLRRNQPLKLADENVVILKNKII
jgi:hypothetical protein